MARKHGFFRPHLGRGFPQVASTTLIDGVGDSPLGTITPDSASVKFLPEQVLASTVRTPDRFNASLVWGTAGNVWGADQAISISCTIPWELMTSGTGGHFHLFGGATAFTSTRRFGIRVDGPQNSSPYRARLYWCGETGQKLDVTLDLSTAKPRRALFVMRKDGSTLRGECYSDGELVASGTQDMTGFSTSRVGATYMVGYDGSGGTPLSASSSAGWPGSIGYVGFYDGSTLQTDFEAISNGADPLVQLTAANWKQYRVLTDTVNSLTAPAGATGDATSAWTFTGNAEAGGDCRPIKSSTKVFAATPIKDGYVFGIMPGQTTATVSLAGIASNITGTIEARMFNRDGQLIKDWTELTGSTIADSEWAGTMSCPKNSGWGWIDVRPTSEPTMVYHLRGRFGVGYKIALLGQSQVEISISASGVGSTPASDTQLSVAFRPASVTTLIPIRAALPMSDAAAKMADLAKTYTTAPVCVIDLGEAGTGIDELLDDAESDRTWTSLTDTLGVTGNDVAAVVVNWATNNMSSGGGDFDGNFLRPLIHGTAPTGGGYTVDHYLTDGTFASGMVVVLSPVTRHTPAGSAGPFDFSGTGTYGAQAAAARADYYSYPSVYPDDDVIVGPPVDDFYIEAAGGPHPPTDSIYGGARLCTRMMIGGMRAIGLDTTTDPSISGAVLTDSTHITVSVTKPNGGNLQTQWDIAGVSVPVGETTVQGFEVSTDSGSNWTRSGFTAEITDAAAGTVVLTKASTSWSAGVMVRYLANGPLDYGTDVEADRLVHGILCEAVDDFEGGIGLPVKGLWSATL